MANYADKVVAELAESDEPTVPIGHSMGGMVIAQAADTHIANDGKLKQLIYAAFVPRDGQSLVDLASQPEGTGNMVQANVQVAGEPPVEFARDNSPTSVITPRPSTRTGTTSK